MENNSEENLEKLIQQKLARLPDVQAPQTLIPRVLAALQHRACKPWWQEPWTAWPFPLRAAALVLFFGLPGLAFYGVNWAWQEYASSALSDAVSGGLGLLASVGSFANTMAHAFVLVGRSLGQVWVVTSITLVAVMYLTCLGVGTVCFQLAAPKR